MRLVSYRDRGDEPCPGLVVPGGVVSLTEASSAAVDLPTITSVRSFLALTGELQASVHRAALARAEDGAIHALRPDELLPPVPDPDKIVCVGFNYRDHADETDWVVPEVPVLFAKYRNALAGPYAEVRIPPITKQVDYEGELAVVVGRRATRLTEQDALSVVAGVMPFNDVSARDLQFQTSQFTAGKTIDGFAPCGPELVSIEEVDDINALVVTTRVNGVEVQRGTVGDMVFSVPRLLTFITSFMTLEPGDIIATGTPAGVGFKQVPPRFLRDGDVVEVDIAGIGTTRNTFRSEPARAS